MGDRGRAIAAAVRDHVRHLTVIYSNPAGTHESGPGDWVPVPDSHVFGRKFDAALRGHRDSILLLLHADTHHDDWPRVVRACAAAFAARADLGLWAPDFDNTQWPTPDVALAPIRGTPLTAVIQTGAIVVAFAPVVCERLRRLDYSGNNLGWGIDWAAIAFCHTNGLLVGRDTGLTVHHDPSRGYGGGAAFDQMTAFFGQLTQPERIQIMLLRNSYSQRREARRAGRLLRLYRRFRPLRPERSWKLD